MDLFLICHLISASGFRAARDAVLRNAAEVMQGLTPGSSPRRRPGSRKTSLNEPDEESSSDPVRGMYSSFEDFVFQMSCAFVALTENLAFFL